MPEIMLEIRNKTPTIIGTPDQIVTDNSDYTMHFSFDDDWLSTSKTVFFVLDDGYAFEPRETVNNFVNVPKILTKRMRHMFIGVQQGDVKTTRPCSICVLPSIASMIDDSAVQPDESMWASVLTRLDRLEKYGGGGGGMVFTPGNALELTDDGVLNVKTASAAENDNTLPITSAAVAASVGNIEILLGTI